MADHGHINVPEVESFPLPAETRSAARAAASPLHSGIGVGTYFALYLQSAIFPLAAGILFYGWRALATVLSVLASAALAGTIWRRIGPRGCQLRIGHCLLLGLLLSLMLPAHLFSTAGYQGQLVWPILPAAAFAAIILSWLLGGSGRELVHPSLAIVLILFVLFPKTLAGHYVLRADRIIVGDLLRADTSGQASAGKRPWLTPPPPDGNDAIAVEPPADKLSDYTSGRPAEPGSHTPEMLIGDQLPPLEDLVIGGQSGPIGTGSAVAVIVGGLFLLYHGLIDFRVPLLAILLAIACLLILPIPVVITDAATHWRWLAFRPRCLGWPTDLTLVNYEILASPLLFTVFFLAGTPTIRPMTRRGRVVFAAVLGVLSAVFQLYVSVSIGPYLALLLAALMTPALDSLLRPRALV